MLIDDVMARNEELLTQALDVLNKRIDVLILQSGTSIELQSALDMRVELAKIFDEEFGGVTREIIKTYATAATEAFKLLKEISPESISFVQQDYSLIDAMMRDTQFEIQGLSMDMQARVGEAIYVGAVAQMPSELIVQQVHLMTYGLKDRGGGAFERHAQTIVRTRFMDTYSVVMKKKAQEAGIDKFRYDGAIVADTREWCAQHLHKIYTSEEISKFNSQDWAGKKQGDVFVTRGGWNCIHRWTPVI